MSSPPHVTPTRESPVLLDSALSRAIIETAEDAIIAKSLDGTVTTWNAGAERLFGYSAAEMIGAPITRLFPPDRQHEEGELIARLLMGKTISHFVTRRVRKDGAHIDVSVTLSPVHDVRGNIVAVSKIARDITETQQRHLAFELCAAIVENSDDAIISKSLDGTVLTWNPGAARIFGYSAAEMIGGSITRLLPPDRQHEEAELTAQLANGKQISHFVTRRLRKTGSPIDVSVTLSPVRDASGKIVAISKIARDITEAYQRQLASAVAAAIVEHSDDAIISKTLDGTVISWNAGAERIFGYTAREMIGGSILRLFPDDRLPEEIELISRVVLGKGVDHFVTQRMRKDGTSIDVSVTLSPVRNAHGQIVAVSKIARDITAVSPMHLPHDPMTRPRAKLTVRGQTRNRWKRVFDRRADARASANHALSEKIDELVRNEQRFQTLVRLTSQLIWTTNPEGHFDSVQPGWSAFTGQSFDDYQGVGWSAAVHPEDAQPTIDAWNRCVADRRPFLFEHRLRRHDGAYRICTIHAAPVLNDDGSIREWVGVHNDIAERRQQEDEIRTQEAKFRVLTEALPQFVWTCKPNGWMDYFNHRWIDYTGLTLEQSRGWGWDSVVHPDDMQHCVRTWNDALESGKAYEVEFRILRASDGSYRWHLMRGVPLRDPQGTIVKWIGTATDIDDYKAADAKNLALQAELEHRVQQRTAELARVGKIAGIGGWSITVANGALHWSEDTCRILDAPPGHQPTMDEAFGLYGPGSREVIEAACRSCMADAVPFDVELELTTTKGRRIWARAVGEAQVEQGAVVRIFGAFQDNTARKLAELELFDQHELLRVTLQSIADGVITTDVHGRVQSLNPVAAQLTGRSASECLGLPVEKVFDIVDAKSQQRTLELIARALSNDNPASTGMDTVLIARDGTQFSIEDSVAPICDKSGERVGTVLVFRDISERKYVANALRVANERFAIAADAAGIGVWEWDLASNMVNWDDQVYRLYGRNRGADPESYSVWASCLHVEDRARAVQELSDAVRDRSNFDTDFRVMYATGEIRHVKAYAQIQCDAAGTAIRMIGVNFDITARKKAELDLKHTSSLLRLVLDSATDLSIIATDPSMTINVFNAGAERLLGYASEEIVGRTTPLLIHDEDEVRVVGEELSVQVGRPVEGPGVFQEPSMHGRSREWSYVRKDGARIAVALVVTPMQTHEGELLGYLGVAQDVTQQRQHEESLRRATQEAQRANSAKSLFLANMSHEIRTPMNAVIGLSYLLEQTSLNPEQTGLLAQINLASKSLLAVITDVLDLSKIEAGELMISRVAFSPRHLLKALLAIMCVPADLKGITLRLDVADDLPAALEGDAARLNQILTNLLSNAIKFTERGGVTLCVRLLESTATTKTLSFTVRDTGIGIDPEAQARLFSPFIQADESITRRYGGTGLGLSIISSLAELMGGTVSFTSTVDVGSEFRVVLAFASATAESLAVTRPAQRARGERPLAGVRVLVVDDFDLNRVVTQRILEQEGALVGLANNGQDAYEQVELRPDHFDVVLMDVQMPIMDGYEATRRIRDDLGLRDLPIIALTAGALSSERLRAIAAGMSDFIIKPFDAATLIASISRHAAGAPIVAAQIGPGHEPPAAAVAWPEIEGIDTHEARSRWCDDLALFRSMLERCLDEFADIAVPSSRGDAHGLGLQAARLHKLRGGACMLGADAIGCLAAEAEAACLAGDAPTAGRLAIGLASQLDALRAGAAQAFDACRTEAPPAAPSAHVHLEPQAVADLLLLMRQSRTSALTQFKALESQLKRVMGDGPFDLMRLQMDNLEFSAAATALEAIVL